MTTLSRSNGPTRQSVLESKVDDRTWRPALLLLLLAATAGLAAGQQPPAGPATAFTMLRGRVVAADDSQLPLRRVKIVLAGTGITATPAYTDGEGRFEIAVPRTPYMLQLTKAGFAPADVASSQLAAPTPVVRLLKGAAIAGRVVDRYGDPIFARVRVLRIEDSRSTTGMSEWSADADDLGEFRAGSLPAGRYQLTVQPTGVPSAAPGGSVTVQLRSGQEEQINLVYESEDPRLRDNGAPPEPVVPGGAVIRGRVIGPEGRAVAGARIMLARAGERPREGFSDTEGRYEFVGLAAGTYGVTAAKWGTSMAMRDRGMEFRVAERQVLGNAHIAMQRPSAVVGSVLDDYGDPIEGVLVEVGRLRRAGGRALLEMGGGPTNLPRRTDDRGRFRVSGVPPGECYVIASEAPRWSGTSPTGPDRSLRVYYPGALAIRDALPVRVVAGQDTLGVNITYAPGSGARIDGYAFDSGGEPVNFPVTLMESFRSGDPLMARREAVVRQDGAFTFLNVPPGDYVVQGVLRAGAGRPSEFAVEHVSVSGADVPPVMLRTTRGTPVQGRVILEGDRSNVRFDQFSVGVAPSDLDYAPIGLDLTGARVDDEGTFELHAQGEARLASRAAPQGWWLKSAMIGAVDVSNVPYPFSGRAGTAVDVVAVFSDTVAEIAGRVTGADNLAAAGATVVVFPVDRSRWYLASRYFKLARPGQGRPDTQSTTPDSFHVPAVPPGDYFIVAVDRFDLVEDWMDFDLLATLAPRADRITVAERQKVIRDLRLVERPRP